MNEPQTAILAPLARCHRHLEYRLSPNTTAADIRPMVNAVLAQNNTVIGFGHNACLQLGQTIPTELKPFSDMGPAKSTQADLWIWIANDDHSEALDSSLALHQLISPYAELCREIDGNQYHQSRDLTGFEDGSANAKTDEARRAAAFINDGSVHSGGSYVLTQQWQHKLPAFNALPINEQEGVIGRTKPDSVELEGDAMPATSHVSRTDVKIDGVAQKVWRRSVPWGGASANGLYFVGFACELSRLDIQLQRMFGLTEDKLKDRLTEFSDPISNSWWFAPSKNQLAAI